TRSGARHGLGGHQSRRRVRGRPSPDDPESFDIARYPNNHLAFGFGTHFCLGNQLARLELSIMQTRLLQRLPDMRLASEADLPLRPANFVSGLEKMPVAFTPSAPLG
ncbi:cytochrome P450, partial [Mycobacterium sp. E735]|uniref:cytochrome P450 n=1 Tax=Mycobacterium sp. E735 TaxID=1834148 RepID=UPI001E37EFD1